MNKLTKLLTATALCATMASAGGFYAGGGLAYESIPDYKVGGDTAGGIGIVLRGGMDLPNVKKNFGVEAEITKSIIDPKVAGNSGSVLTMAGYAVYTINITKQLYAKPRFGMIFPNLGGTYYSDADVVNSRDIGFTSGIGGGFRLNRHMNIYFDYTILGEGITNWGSGVEYHF